ncbi:MAG TPA: 2OG-Fe dioxygenase family protein [Xanthomonadales bacterium]|nr:2OG-Fe dioxygenase family protein [Xanthomonadales bacterium]
MSVVALADDVRATVGARGFAVVPGDLYRIPELRDRWAALSDDWNHLEIDAYMADGGRYRRRRFGRFAFVPATAQLQRLPHATVFQSREVNGFAGGIDRDFAPLRESTFGDAALLALIRFDFGCFEVPDATMLTDTWEVWVHQIRIDAAGSDGVSPAPEGTHHDGHDFIAMHLVTRNNIAGGLNHIYDNGERPVHACMLRNPLDTIYADDHRVMHAVDPIRPLDAARPSYRDILIIDYDHRPALLRGG